VTIYAGCEVGLTLGTPIAMIVNNLDQRPHDYGDMSDIPRPSHADFTYQVPRLPAACSLLPAACCLLPAA
jgi:chorismate synthase